MRITCNLCQNYKWHSRYDDPEPLNSMGFHYCSKITTNCPPKERRALCEKHKWFIPK